MRFYQGCLPRFSRKTEEKPAWGKFERLEGI
nr:MAG TPA: hypothetical protein [Caudoviricetes sp.]